MESRLVGEQWQDTGLFNEVLVVLFKHKLNLIIVFLAVFGCISAMTLRLAPVYVATTSFLVKNEREYLLRPEVGANAPNSSGQEGTISAATQILTSRELAEKVIKSIGIGVIYPDLELNSRKKKLRPLDIAVMQFEKNLTVESINKSNVIKVTLENLDPVVAAAALNLLIEYYKEKHLKVFSEPHALYLEQQLDDYVKKLGDSDDRLEKFKSNNRIYSLDEQRTLLSKQRIDLDTALKTCTNSVRELQGRVAVLRGQLSEEADSSVTISSEEVATPRDAKANKSVYAETFLKEQEAIARRKARFDNPLYLELHKALLAAEADLKAQSLKAQSLSEQVNSVGHLLGSLNLNEQQLAFLVREKTVNEKNYQSYRERVDESRRLDDMNRRKLGNISILQPATPPLEPSKPKKAKIVLLGMVAGVVAGVGSVFIAEYRSGTLSTPRQVERLLGVPVLLSIPYHEV